MGGFSYQIAKSHNAIYLDIGQPSTEGQEQAKKLGQSQYKLEHGESVLVQELEMFEQAIRYMDQESKAIRAELVAKVEAEFQAQQACQAEQAVYSQLQDEQLGDHILQVERDRINDQANYKAEIEQNKEKGTKVWREQQGQHEAQMVRLHEIMIELKAQVGAILAQRSVALTVVNDNRDQPVQNTDGVLTK